MTKLMTTLTISVIASIMIIGGFVLAPDAYSTNDNNEPDECACEKPDTLKVKFNAPTNSQESTFKIDVFKKLEDRNNPNKDPLMTIENVMHGDDDLTISSIMFAKDRLESNTAFVVYKIGEDEPVALMEIHTSCSKPLFIGKTVSNNEYSLVVTDGLKLGITSIPESEPLTCEDKKAKSTGTITIRKALTNDNDGTANVEDFTITVTNVKTTESFVLEKDQLDLSINVKDVPQGTYKISETGPDGYTTVMITGDTKCPSMLGEEFTIKKGKNLSCTIYNDDDFNGDSSLGAGVVFNPTNLTFSGMSGPTCSAPSEGYIKTTPACIEFNGDSIFVTDVELTSTAIIVWSLVQSPIPEEISAPQCTLEGLQDTGFLLPNGNHVLTFVLACPNGLISGTNNYALNFALIET